MSFPMETCSRTNEIHRLIFLRYPHCPKTLTPGTHIERDLGGDSLSYLELVMDIKNAFDISLPDKEAGSVQTVGELVELVQKHVPGK